SRDWSSDVCSSDLLVPIRWHQRIDEAVLDEVGLLERAQPLVEIEELHGERVVVQQPALPLFAGAGHDSIEPIVRLNLERRIENRRHQMAGAAKAADPAQVGADTSAAPVDPMAVRALALALEERLAALGVAREPGLVVRPCVVTQEQHELLDLVLVEIRGAHLGARDPVHDDVRELAVAQGAAEHASAEVDPFDGVAALAVTRGAGGL